jgi:hypothetical protein
VSAAAASRTLLLRSFVIEDCRCCLAVKSDNAWFRRSSRARNAPLSHIRTGMPQSHHCVREEQHLGRDTGVDDAASR